MASNITYEQNRANLRSAERFVAIQLGIDNQSGTWRELLTYENRVAYDKTLAAYILAHPSAFADSTVETARVISNQNLTPLDDTSFNYSDFVSGTIDNVANAGNSVAGIGTGILNTANAASWAIPLVIAVVLVIAISKYSSGKTIAPKV